MYLFCKVNLGGFNIQGYAHQRKKGGYDLKSPILAVSKI